MKLNLNNIERVVRVVIALALLAFTLTGGIVGLGRTFAIIVGVVILLTGLIGFCPIYRLFKFSSRKS